MPAEALLSATGITVVMGEKTLLNDVSVVARRGEVLGLIGPNGAGKSTLLSVLSGDLIPFSGSVSICGYDPVQASVLELAKSRSVMLQDVSVSFAFLVRDVVSMGRRPWARTDQSARDDAIIDAALAATEVSHLSDRDIMTLSGGERARVALSRVLAQQTPVVLLDEPTAALDIGHQEQALGLVRALAKNGAAVIVVLHDLNAAAAYCDRIVCLADGTVAAQGTVAEVYAEETLTAVYGWDIQVVSSPAGDVQVFPKRGREAGVDNDLQETLSELFNLTFN